ncbi:putative GTP binding domain, P-loop containing nucleoside triphosphate hydrolase [Helianthus annuus]|nr:putative GTP binding domain, P-loop containing nucleoside triphosphate hydrolase [Helianthus annuus]
MFVIGTIFGIFISAGITNTYMYDIFIVHVYYLLKGGCCSVKYTINTLGFFRGSTFKMAKTQKNKAIAHHLGLLKAKLAKLRRGLLTPTSKGGGGAGESFDFTKSGDARVGLVGFPSLGKSTLLNKLTDTFSEVVSYEFTTLTCISGVNTYRGAKIQVCK